MFCTVCAAANPIAAVHCHGCGRRLLQPDAGVRGGDRPTRGTATLLVLAPLVVLLALGAGYHRAEQAELASSYARGAAAEAAGRYPEALDAFAAAAGYRDAAARRAALATVLAPAQEGYLRGARALGAGDHDAAIAALLPVVRQLPRYQDAADLLNEARRLRAADLLRQADAAEARRDWLAAERALSALLAADRPSGAPADSPLAARLAALRRHHAPLVLARGHALYLIGPDGADERLLTSEVPVARPVWSPDRTRIAFIAGNPNDPHTAAALYVIGSDGTGLAMLTGAVHPNAVPAWSPDGTRIAYTSVARWHLRREQGLLTVHVVDVATGVDTDVTGSTRRHAMTPTWSPTGDRLAFVSRRLPTRAALPATGGPGDVYVLNLATGDIADLTEERVPDVLRVAWSPTDERLLLYARTSGVNAGTASTTARIYTLGADDGELDVVAAGIEALTAASIPAWAPDGERFAYVSGMNTLVIQERGGQETRVEARSYLSGALSWSPDGRALLAVAADPDQPSAIVELGDDGPSLSDLPVTYDADWPTGTPQWSPPIPARLPAAESIGGTALDPDPPSRTAR